MSISAQVTHANMPETNSPLRKNLISDESLESAIKRRGLLPKPTLLEKLNSCAARCLYGGAQQWIHSGYKVSETPVALGGPGDCLAVSADGDTLLTCDAGTGDDGVPRVVAYSARAGKIVRQLEGHMATVRCVAIDGDVVASGGDDDTVRLWSLESGMQLAVLEGHDASVCGLAMDGDYVLSGSSDATVRLWSVQETSCIEAWSGHTSGVNGVALSGAIGVGVSAGADGTARVWPLSRGAARIVILLHPELSSGSGETSNAVHSVSVEEETIATGAQDCLVRTWALATSAVTRELPGHTSPVSCVRLLGTLLVSGAADKTCRVWSIAAKEGQCVTTIDVGYSLAGLACSPLGFVASVVGAGKAKDDYDRLVVWRPVG